MRPRWLSATLSILLCACGQTLHTVENTGHLSQAELAALCEDLRMRASMDCQWNMREQQSTLENQQTWEVNCRARRDFARDSFDNACESWRFLGQPEKEDNPGDTAGN